MVDGIDAPSFPSGPSDRVYQQFLAAVKSAKPLLDQRYGSDWVIVFLIDELDTAITSLPDDQFFQNLRNFLMMSDFHSHFRLVASGVTGMAKLISSGSSPLNNLRNKHLGILTGKQTRQLITHGFPDGLEPEVELSLLHLTGKHPYLLQGLLEKLYETQAELDPRTVKSAGREFLREHHDFARWLESFDRAEHAVYQALFNTTEGTLSTRDIRGKVDATLAPQVDDALTILSYHGVIDDSDPDEPQIAGTMFRDWYRDNAPRLEKPKVPTPQPPQAIRVFCSYAHEDEAFRKKLETHLSLLKRQGFIEIWHDRRIGAGQEWKNAIDNNLETADLILFLVSADFLASDYCMDVEMERALARHNRREARTIPVIIRHVDWATAPFAKLQALPQDGKPVNKWNDSDEAWEDFAKGIRLVVEELRKR
jgi:hypothetical protein